MKLFTLLLVLITNVGFAQNWNPFVFNQNSYYKQQYNDLAKVENFFHDSILNNGNTQTLYFNAKSGLKPGCDSNIKASLQLAGWLNDPQKIDSLIKINDDVFFIEGLDTFVFKPLAQLNDTWLTNGITIKCAGLGVANILGNQDSIKTYTCQGNGYDGITFILSKHYGFVQFLPFNAFLSPPSSAGFPPYFELVGYSDGLITTGYYPDFSDYFHLSQGDILYWRDYNKPYNITVPSTTRYHKDSVKSAYISNDSVHYSFKRTSYYNGSIVNGNYSTHHLRKDEGAIIQNNTGWYGLKYGGPYPIDLFTLESLHFKIENGDTVSYIEYQTAGFNVDTSNCVVDAIADYDQTVRFSSREGLIFLGSYYFWGESSLTLMGSLINGVEHGNTEIPVKIDEISFDNIRVYPNPFTDYITIDAPNETISQIEIFDITGNLIRQQKTNVTPINLKELSDGIYILKITDAKDRTRKIRLSKQ